MGNSEAFRQVVDLYAETVLACADPYDLANETVSLDFSFDHDYMPAALADRARWDISELADAPWGPQSMLLCVATLSTFATKWTELADKDDEAVQIAFFEQWISRAQALLSSTHGT